MGLLAFAGLGLAAWLVAAAPTANPDFDAARPHHRPDGFSNRYLPARDKPGFWRWQWERRRDGLPRPPDQPIRGIAPDLTFLQANQSETSLTWVGHATLLLQIDGLNILTDPHWSERASPVAFAGPRRHQAPGLPFEALPRIDAVLISHNHYDHLDLPTVIRLMQQPGGAPRFYVPLGVQHWFAKNVPGAVLEGPGQNVFALDWDEQRSLPGRTQGLELRFLAVQHWSSRTPWDRNETLWGSWAVLHPGFRFWFSGDLGYSRDTQDIGEQLGRLDLAAIAIGAYEPRWFMKDTHLNPAEAVQVRQDVRARQAVGIHWGTFEGLTDESLDQPPRDLARARQGAGLAEDDFFVMRHGQTRRFGPLQPPGSPGTAPAIN